MITLVLASWSETFTTEGSIMYAVTNACTDLLAVDWSSSRTNNLHFRLVSAFRPRGSLDRRVNCRRVPQPRWVGARWSTKGGETGKGKTRGLRVVLRPGRVRLQ
jgi:hypothetical protein